MSNTVWIFAEHQRGEITESSLELVCEGRRLAGLRRHELCALLFGRQIEALAKTLARYGAETVYLADHEVLATYHPELFTDMLAGLVKTYDPGILLLSSSILGQDLAPRVAARLRTNLVPNCDKLELSDEGLLLQTRLIYQNKIHTTVVCPGGKPQMATLAPGIAKIKESATPKAIRIVPVAPTDFLQPESQRIEVTGFIKADPKAVDISDAALIVSGGKGVQDDAGFQLIRGLADVLDATVAGSRMAVDNQWIDRTRQIGQSGKTVSPDLMISCGISGASAHIFGMRDTKTLIAINKDKAAPIMRLADLAVVGDLHEILPMLIERLRDINAPKA
jgi:electron transfer flavoprotein alpha subunit